MDEFKDQDDYSKFSREAFIERYHPYFNFTAANPEVKAILLKSLSSEATEMEKKKAYFGMLSNAQLIYYGRIIQGGKATIFITTNNEDNTLRNNRMAQSEGHVIVWRQEFKDSSSERREINKKTIDVDLLPKNMFCKLLISEFDAANLSKENMTSIDQWFVPGRLEKIQETSPDECSLFRMNKKGERVFICNPPKSDPIFTCHNTFNSLSPSESPDENFSWTDTLTGGSSHTGIHRFIINDEKNPHKDVYYRYFIVTHCVNRKLTDQLKQLLREQYQDRSPTIDEVVNHNFYKKAAELAQINAERLHHRTAKRFKIKFHESRYKVDVLAHREDSHQRFPRLLIPQSCNTYNHIILTKHTYTIKVKVPVQNSPEEAFELQDKRMVTPVYALLDKNTVVDFNKMYGIMTHANGPFMLMKCLKAPLIVSSVPVCTGRKHLLLQQQHQEKIQQFDNQSYIKGKDSYLSTLRKAFTWKSSPVDIVISNEEDKIREEKFVPHRAQSDQYNTFRGCFGDYYDNKFCSLIGNLEPVSVIICK